VVRLTDGATVFMSELIALCIALGYIQTQSHTKNTFIIFTDSLCVLQSLSGNGNGSNPEIVMLTRQGINELVLDLNIDLIIAWVPGHANIPGNTRADLLANNALSHGEINIEIKPSTTEHLTKINLYTLSKWQAYCGLLATKGSRPLLSDVQPVVT